MARARNGAFRAEAILAPGRLALAGSAARESELKRR